METINIKFDKEQLEEVVKKVTEKLKKEKDNFYELSDTAQEKVSVMYLEFNEANHASRKVNFTLGMLSILCQKTMLRSFIYLVNLI